MASLLAPLPILPATSGCKIEYPELVEGFVLSLNFIRDAQFCYHLRWTKLATGVTSDALSRSEPSILVNQTSGPLPFPAAAFAATSLCSDFPPREITTHYT